MFVTTVVNVTMLSFLFSLPSPFVPTHLLLALRGQLTGHTPFHSISWTLLGSEGHGFLLRGRDDVGKWQHRCPMREVLEYVPDLLSLCIGNLILILSLIDQISCISILAVAVPKMKGINEMLAFYFLIDTAVQH